MLIQETFVNATKGYQFGDSGPYAPFTDDIAELFRSLQKEYGRCESAVYVDGKGGVVKRIGWVFSKAMRYEDSKEKYTREVWVTLLDKEDTVERTHHYHALGGHK